MLDGKRIAILAEEDFEDSELIEVHLVRIEARGAGPEASRHD